MTSINITYDQVVDIIQKIAASGERPTINRIREALDNQGSVPVIARFLKQWRETNNQHVPLEEIQALPIQSEKPKIEPKIETPVMLAPETPKPQVTPVVAAATEPAPAHGANHGANTAEAAAKQPSPESNPQNSQTDNRRPRHPRQQQQQQQNQQRRPRPDYQDHFEPSAPYTPKVVDFDKPYPEVPESVENFLSQKAIESENYDNYSLDALFSLNKETLITKVRHLASQAKKEQTRAEVAERMARDARTYSDSIKAMVTERISFSRDAMQVKIDQLQLELRQHKSETEKALLVYQQQLNKANAALVTQAPAEGS